MRDSKTDWDPGAWNRFRDFRWIAALDMLSAVGLLPNSDRVDPGCLAPRRDGVARRAVPQQGSRRLIGVDRSAAISETASVVSIDSHLEAADIAGWKSKRELALDCSKGTLHWLPEPSGSRRV